MHILPSLNCYFVTFVVTNYGKRGGGYKTGGGACEVLPLLKGVFEKVLAMLKGVHKAFSGSFYMVAWSFLP